MYADVDNIRTSTARTSRWSLLRSRAYLVLLAAQFASLLADFFNYVAVAWLVLELTGSNLAVGGVLAAASVPRALLMLLGGAVSDRFSPRTSMVAGGLARGLVMGTLAVLALTHTVQLWHLFVGSVLIGIIAAFFLPASTSMLPRVVASDQLEAGNAFMMLSRFGAAVLGPALSGVMVATVGAGAAFAVDAAGYVLAGLLVTLLPGAARTDSGSRNSALLEIWEGIVWVWNDVPLRAALVVIALVNFLGLPGVEVGLPALAHQRFDQGAVALGGALGTSEANFIGAPEAGSLEARLLARKSDRFLPTWRGRRLPEGELAGLPVRTGSTRPYVPYTPLFRQSVADVDGIAFLRSATYTRGAPKLPE